jgi:hypothetical protein
VAPGSSVPSNTEARRSRRRTATDGERVLQGDEWRRLSTANTNDDEERAARWANGNMPWEMDVVITSKAEHCECRTRVRPTRSRYVQSGVPDGDTQRLRHELEGMVVGPGGHVQQTERFNLLAADPSADLVGFSDGSLSGDGSNAAGIAG